MSQEEYIVEEILEKRINRLGKTEYLVKWEGYKVSESTWEPIENLENSQDLILDFEERDAIKKREKEKNNDNATNNNVMNGDVNTKESNNNNNSLNKQDHIIIRDIEDNMPKKIKSVKKIDGELFSLVEWEERSDGLTPDVAYIPSMILRTLNPKLLIEFYESKIKFVNKK